MSSVFTIEIPGTYILVGFLSSNFLKAQLPWDMEVLKKHLESHFVLQFEIHFETILKVTMQGQMLYSKVDSEELMYFLGSVDARV